MLTRFMLPFIYQSIYFGFCHDVEFDSAVVSSAVIHDTSYEVIGNNRASDSPINDYIVSRFVFYC